jgi:hypothetical protein
MKPNSLTNALPIVAAAYGRKFGVAVQVGGTVAQTDGRTIAVPAIGDDPVARTLAWGYLTHEAAHVRYTDFDAVRRTAAKGPLAKGILNIMEDVRIENAILGPYPGARGTLDAVNGWLIEHDQLAAPGEGDAPHQRSSGTRCWSWVITVTAERPGWHKRRRRPSASCVRPFHPASCTGCSAS